MNVGSTFCVLTNGAMLFGAITSCVMAAPFFTA